MAEQKGPIVHAMGAISSLQSFSCTLLEARSQLKEKCFQTKEEIYTAISRQHEALRDREIWLLDRVDAEAQLKEEQMQAHLMAVTRVLGSLEENLALSQTGADQPLVLSALSDTLARISDFDHTPMEEVTGISFQAKVDQLRRKIHTFGSVSSSMCLERGCATPSPSSSALPTMFRGLGLQDPEEAFPVFAEIKPSSFWLRNVEVPQPSWHTASPQCTPFGTNHSLSHWLVREEHREDDCTENDDMDTAHLPIKDDEVKDGSAYSSDKLLEQMESILSSPPEMWLSDSDSRPSHHAEQRISSNVPDGSKEWLLVSDRMEEELPSPCVCIKSGDKPVDMDIENLASLLCVQQIQQPSPFDTDTSSWLAKSADRPEEDLPPIGHVCRANEVCGSFSECVCDEICGGDGGPWLAAAPGEGGSRPSFQCFDREFLASDWLASSEKEDAARPDCDEEGNYDWLCDEVSEERQFLKCLEGDTSMALLRDGDADLDSVSCSRDAELEALNFKYHSSLRNSEWLKARGKEDGDVGTWLLKKRDFGKGSIDSNKWLVGEIKGNTLEKNFENVITELNDWLVV